MVIFVKYGLGHLIAERKMDLSKEGDTVVLIQNGVFWLLNKEKMGALKEKKVNIVALKDDFLSRGYKESDTTVPLISYDELITILEKDQKVLG
ncbi:MAG: sulfurtransferase complex subunit TusB [Caldisericia bacterium]|nr:sulfurtransferase complex subunit TusB [Caldisericia bacterium]